LAGFSSGLVVVFVQSHEAFMLECLKGRFQRRKVMESLFKVFSVVLVVVAALMFAASPGYAFGGGHGGGGGHGFGGGGGHGFGGHWSGGRWSGGYGYGGYGGYPYGLWGNPYYCGGDGEYGPYAPYYCY
jgi:hypothetical protein